MMFLPIRQALILNHLPQRVPARIRQQVDPFGARRVHAFAATTPTARTRRDRQQDCDRCEQHSTNLHNAISRYVLFSDCSEQCSSSVDYPRLNASYRQSTATREEEWTRPNTAPLSATATGMRLGRLGCTDPLRDTIRRNR